MRKKIIMLSCFLTVVIFITISVIINNEKEVSGNINVSILDVKGGKDAIVTIVSDDGYPDTVANLYNLSQKYNIPITIASTVQNAEPNIEEYRRYEKESKLEFISHSWSHIKLQAGTTIDENILNHEIVESIDWFRDNFTTDQICYVPAENTMTNRGYAYLKKEGIVAVRQSRRGDNYLSPLEGIEPYHWYNLGAFGVRDTAIDNWYDSAPWSVGTESDTIAIDRVLDHANNNWIIEMWHDVAEKVDDRYQCISIEDAVRHLDYAVNKNLWFAGFVEATKYIYEKENANINITRDKGNLIISLEMKELDPDIYNEPLTVKVAFSEKDDIRKISEIYPIYEGEDETYYILVDIMPNENIELTIY